MDDDELDLDELYEDDPDAYDAWLDLWIEKCGGLRTGASPCPLVGTAEHDFECPFRTKYDTREAADGRHS